MRVEPCDLEAKNELEPIGRARRFRADDETCEIWLLPRSEERAAKRLLDLGEKRLGGFMRGGIDGENVWLVRRASLSSRADRSARPWREAIGIVHALAVALDACESRGLFPGPLRWSEIALDPPCVAANALVRAIVGAQGSHAKTSSEPSLKWTPPEQAAGAPWDGAANRYVLGLVAYRLISGAHPFEGAGLRHAAQAQASSEPAPFEERIAVELKPGVQSFVLRMIAPDPSARPKSARAIAESCEELLAIAKKNPPSRSRETAEKRLDSRASSRAESARAPRKLRPPPQRLPRAMLLAPVVAGALAVGVALAARTETAPKIKKVADVTPIDLDTASVASCGSCHAREVAEWSRSAMSFSARSPLYGALESLVEEEFGRTDSCPNGAGALRSAGPDACFDDRTRVAVTGAGGEGWCINCHSPASNLEGKPPAWTALGNAAARRPAIDLLSNQGKEGVSCIACHSTIRGVDSHARATARAQYEGNAEWRSFLTGRVFDFRPEDASGLTGIANSGYFLDAKSFFRDALPARPPAGDPIVHRLSSAPVREYRASSEFCGACHDVRLFGTDAIGKDRGEHFKRLRNAYSEWKVWADGEERAGRKAATCQGCHMSLFPGTCEPGEAKGGAERADCPPGSHLITRAPGELGHDAKSAYFSHYFTSVDTPLSRAFDDSLVDDRGVDAAGLPVGLRARQRMLLEAAFRFRVGDATRSGSRLSIPIEIENTGAGHRVPAGFSQEREIWVELEVKDARGGLVYEVGHLASAKDDLKDKIMTRVNVDDTSRDFAGRPLGVFGADVVDGVDVPQWSPNPALGGTRFEGKGLVNFQNGFLRCVRCIGEIGPGGECEPLPGQGRTRADRFDDGAYDPDTGECRSNLSGGHELFETYFPVGALDADRGLLKAPDAIIDTRSAPPNVPIVYTYALDAGSHPPPFEVRATLHFRAFPPYLIRAFADYEALRAQRGERPSGPQVDASMLGRLEILDIGEGDTRIE